MIQWLNPKQLADKLSVSLRTVQNSIAAGRHKNTPLLIQQKKTNERGRPTYVVAWNTDRNQPATEMKGEDHVNDASTTQPNRRADSNSASPVSVSQPPAQPLRLSAELSTPCVQLTTDTSPSQSDTARTPAQTPLQSMDGITPVALSADVPEGYAVTPQTGELVKFEDLIHRKVAGKDKNKARALTAYYRKQYTATGKIPQALFEHEGRKLSGRKSELPEAIQKRFIEMCENACNPASPEYRGAKLRVVTNFHARLERELACTININQLYTVLDRNLALKNRLKTPDGAVTQEAEPKYFKSEPVGSLIMMDGVTTDYIFIPNGKDGWYAPTLISLYDMGSRKYLSKHAYRSENNEDSVDVLIRALVDNTFIAQTIVLRPDNAKAFLNLERPIFELNQRYGSKEGLTLIFDAARVGEPKDKCHLESIHTKVHKRLEDAIITHFQDRVVEWIKKTKVTGNKKEIIDVAHLNITLDELNASGLVKRYTDEHNAILHRFTDDNEKKKWIPNHRWDAALKDAKQTHTFSIIDAELCRIYGHTKYDATVDKTGLITWKGQKYYLANNDHFNRNTQASTKVRIAVIGDELAVFNPNQKDGRLVGKATVLQAPEKSEKLLARTKAKVDKAHASSDLEQQINRLKDLGLKVNREVMHDLIKAGMTAQIFEQAIAHNDVILICSMPEYVEKMGFSTFNSTVLKLLPQPEVKPYAAVK